MTRVSGPTLRGILPHLVLLALAGCGDAADPDAALRDAAPPTDGATPTGDAGPADAAVPATDGGGPPPGPVAACAPLPAPAGAIVRVDPGMAASLPALVRDAAPDTTFLLADGVYRMTGGESERRIVVRADGVTLRSASGDAAAVVIDGEYTTFEVLSVVASRVTVAELTITHAVDHCVHVTPPDGGADVRGFTMHGVRLRDCGEQFLKVNPNTARSAFVDEGTVSCSDFELTDAGRPYIERSPGGCYTGGIDVHAARGWQVRDNDFRGLYCAGEGLAEHAIHFWIGSRDTVVERNRIVDCARGVGFGLVESGPSRAYPDDPAPGLFVGHYGGVIRNNVIVADVPWYDTGIELAQARGAVVVHNTILELPGATGSFSSIDTRFDNAITTVRNNLARRITVRSGTSTADHNLESIDPSLFVDAAGGDLHLAASASAAIDQGVPVAEATRDLDGDPRDDGAPDLGADER